MTILLIHFYYILVKLQAGQKDQKQTNEFSIGSAINYH